MLDCVRGDFFFFYVMSETFKSFRKKKKDENTCGEREREEACVANVNERIECIGVHCTVPSTLVV